MGERWEEMDGCWGGGADRFDGRAANQMSNALVPAYPLGLWVHKDLTSGLLCSVYQGPPMGSRSWHLVF